MKRFVCLLLLGLSSLSVADCAADGDGYFMYADFWCAIEQTQVEYLVDWYFNKEFTMQYNSTVGNWTGFTPAGFITASLLNEDKQDAIQRKVERQLICVDNVGILINTTEENIAEPSVTLAETTSYGHDGTMLVCSAYDFYPRFIRVTWYQNGQEVTSGVTISEVMSNGDWTYQVHSYLEYTPGGQDRVSCMVEHASLREPKIYEWGSQSERSYLIGGVCALLLGAVFLSLGLIQYRKKRCDPRC
ncbi:rano class II histocompatibility antigen, A beta chain-like [Morone saxatilis]|uniref:rano class II histocompatibility antigen, A beta chain-like n=1 Tax=Morone saxatilis TaxID=34816 RepID=UPI0015E24341|nr:rano class II histocompatibility antigen, A beta chain-like [Morone saxatilis]XP_035518334.1 rano class II histocompatibility antigen, A beta chain-like [Morone saxatilis]